MYSAGAFGAWVALDRGQFVDAGYVPSMASFSNVLLVLVGGMGAAIGLTVGTVLLLVGVAVWRQKPLAYLAQPSRFLWQRFWRPRYLVFTRTFSCSRSC